MSTLELEEGDTGEALLPAKVNAKGVHADRDKSEAPRPETPSTEVARDRDAESSVADGDEWITEERWLLISVHHGGTQAYKTKRMVDRLMLTFPGSFTAERMTRRVTPWVVQP